MTSRSLLLLAALSLIGAGIWLALESGPAGAHAVQVGSSPRPNEQLAVPPDVISIAFSEPIEPSVSTIQLWDASPQQIDLPAVRAEGSETLTVDVPDDLPPGLYTVIWRNLSTVDGHTWSGSFPFIMLGPNGEVPEGTVPASLQELAAPPSERPNTLESTARWVVLLGSAVMLGGAAYVAFVALPSGRLLSGESALALGELSRRVLVISAAIAAFLVLQGSLVQLVLQADRLGALGKTDDLLLDTRLGHYLIARQVLVAFALLGVVLVARARSGGALRVALGALLAASFGVLLTQSLVSHAAAGAGAVWTVAADLLHLLAASAWIGALVHIGLAMPRWLDELRGVPRTLFAAESFRRFSVLAAFSVLVLMVSGVLSALAQFTSWPALWDTTYGWSLIGKLAAMLPLLAVAGLNAFFLQPRVVGAAQQLAGGATDEGPAAAQAGALHRLLVTTVRLEAVLGIAVLVAVAVLIQLQPPRAIAEAEAARDRPIAGPQQEEAYLKATQAGGLVVSLEIDPARVGTNTFEVGLGSEFGGVGEVLDVRLDFDHADESIGQSRLELPLAGSAKFEAEGSNLSLPGEWTVTANIRRRGEDEDVRATFDVPLAGETAKAEGLWHWPFEGARSAGAIAALAVGGVGLVAVAGWQARSLRRSR
jgi:copper transport protein